MRFLSILFLVGAIIVRIIVLQRKFYQSIVSWTLVIFLLVDVTEIIYSQSIFTLELGDRAFWSLIIISGCSVISLFFYSIFDRKTLSKTTQNIMYTMIISKRYFYLILFLYAGALIIFLKNFLLTGLTYNFQMNLLNANSDKLVSGLFGYFFMFGIAIILFLPYVNIQIRTKIILVIIILIGYLMYPRRLYLFITCMILLIEYSSKVRIKKRYIGIFAGIFIIFFHITQFLLNKSVYNQLVLQYGVINSHLQAMVLDPLIYFIGNISNIDYISNLPVGNEHILLNNTLYPLYSMLNTFGFKSIAVLTNVFVPVGSNYSTNTVAYIAYYIQEGGLMYAGTITLLIFLMLEFISKKNTRFSKISYPFFLSSGVLLFRENDYLLIYFYVVVIIVLVGSWFTQQNRENI